MYEMQFVAVNCSSTAEVSAVELQLTGGPAWVLIVHFLELEVVLNSTYYTTTYYYYYYYYFPFVLGETYYLSTPWFQEGEHVVVALFGSANAQESCQEIGW